MDVPLVVSALEPPEPMERILDALAELAGGDRLRVLHRRQPFPLYDLLRRTGYAWETTGAEGRYEILIWQAHPSGESGPRPC